MPPIKKLSELGLDESAVILRLENSGVLRRRLASLGMVPGADVKALFKSICGDPTAYLVQSSVIAIRKKDADSIIVIN